MELLDSKGFPRLMIQDSKVRLTVTSCFGCKKKVIKLWNFISFLFIHGQIVGSCYSTEREFQRVARELIVF